MGYAALAALNQTSIAMEVATDILHQECGEAEVWEDHPADALRSLLLEHEEQLVDAISAYLEGSPFQLGLGPDRRLRIEPRA